MGKIKTINVRISILLTCFVISCATIFYSGFAFAAGLEVSLDGIGDWDITESGTVILAPGEEKTSPIWCGSDGYYYNGNCWYEGPISNNCNTECADKGGCTSGTVWDQTTSCAVCGNWVGGSCLAAGPTDHKVPYSYSGNCYYGSGTSQCDYYQVGTTRYCVCDYTPPSWELTGSSDGVEDIDIKVTSTGNWSASTDENNGVNTFVLRETDDSGLIIPGTDVRLKDDLGQQPEAYSFSLWFKAPAVDSETGQHTLTVTLTAKNWQAVCGGYVYGGYCWYAAQVIDISCDEVCADYGGCLSTDTTWNDPTCAVMNYFFGSKTCANINDDWLPATALSVSYHRYRNAATPNVSCSATTGITNYKRICACDQIIP